MKDYTVKSFAKEYRVDGSTARKYLNALVESGRATAVRKPLPIRFKGKEIVYGRTVTTYAVKELVTCPR